MNEPTIKLDPKTIQNICDGYWSEDRCANLIMQVMTRDEKITMMDLGLTPQSFMCGGYDEQQYNAFVKGIQIAVNRRLGFTFFFMDGDDEAMFDFAREIGMVDGTCDGNKLMAYVNKDTRKTEIK